MSEARRDALVASDAHLGVVGGVAVEPEASEDIFHFFVGHALFFGDLVVGVEVLVESSEGDAGSGVFFVGHDEHVGEPEGLDGFVEVSCAVPGDLFHVVGHVPEFCGACVILFFFGEALAV